MVLLKGLMIYMGNEVIELIQIEIFDSRVVPANQIHFKLPIEEGKLPSIYDALKFAKIVDHIDNSIFQKKVSVGVFGVALGPNDPIYDGDRIELYRPILIDPKKIRRKKANQNKDAELKNKAKLRKERKDLREI